MVGRIFSVLCILSFASALYTGRLSLLSDAVLEGAARAVTLTLSLLGMMCLWCGVLSLLQKSGVLTRLCRLLMPILRRLFPTAAKTGEGIEEIAMSISANLLGVGNAATPFALLAMEKMQAKNPEPDRATDDMVTLTVLSCASLNLLPTTLLAMRHAAGSEQASAVVLPILLVSAAGAAIALLLARLGCRRRRTGC